MRPREHEYISSPEDFEWLPGAPEGAALLAGAGYFLAVVSNQRGVALGVTPEATLAAVEDRIQRGLQPLGCRIDAFSYCTHHIDAACPCRKPAPGLLLDVAAGSNLDLTRSWMVGDDESDVLAGRAAGCMTALIGGPEDGIEADVVAASLLHASRIITGRS